MVVRCGSRRTTHRLRLLRLSHLKQKKQLGSASDNVVSGRSSKSIADAACGTQTASADSLSETALRNIALEAVRTGNYYAAPEEQEEVLRYISELHRDLLADQKWLRKNSSKLKKENGLTLRYTVAEILAKNHERDGYNVFLDAEEACAVASAAEAEASKNARSREITAGTMLVARKNVRIFASTSSWQQIGTVSIGQRVEAADAPRLVEGFEMVSIRPEGAIEVRHIDQVAKETIGEEAGSTAESTHAADELALGRLAELQEGLDAVVDAEDGSNDPIGVDELLELLEGCAVLGELGAAVYCGERVEALHHDGSQVNLPGVVLDRMFQALKPLLRPGSGKHKPDLHGPWSQPPPGRAGIPNPRKRLGPLLNRVATARKEKDLAEAGEDAQIERHQAAETTQMLQSMSATLATLLAKDTGACACRRRGPLGEAVVRVCSSHGLAVSSALAFVLIGELENLGVVKSHGRELEFNKDAEAKSNSKALSAFKTDIALLEDFAKERLNRRRKRQQAREKGRAAKRKCAGDDD
mmetsp:Transcript_18229/g.29122  ORF Transcript_18229/g.29122 Transcript_18229/m.29122 type:complete len:528 (-) Transcript_18229:37-1620(-)